MGISLEYHYLEITQVGKTYVVSHPCMVKATFKSVWHPWD